MGLSLKEMQLIAEAEFSVEDTRCDLGDIVRFYKAQEYHEQAIDVMFCEERQLPKWIAEEHDVFYVDEDINILEIPEEFKFEALGFVKRGYVIFNGRMVYPVKDVRGQVMGFCGWDKYETPKYLDSKNHGYLAKSTTLFGMEKLPEYYSNNKPVYVVEGIICCLYLRSIGLQALALLGSSMTTYVIEILKRFGSRLVVIPDNDVIGKEIGDINDEPAGEHLVKRVKWRMPQALVVQSTVAKDPDDTRKCEEHKYKEQFKRDLVSISVNPFIPVSTLRVR